MTEQYTIRIRSVCATATNVNDAPIITSTAVTAVNEDAAYSYTVTTNDVDSDTVTITGTTAASWMSFNTNTGALTGTPTNSHVGSHSVVISTASDGNGGSVTDTFSVVVSETLTMLQLLLLQSQMSLNC